MVQLQAVDIGRGSEALYRDQLPGLLHSLADRARVASITASSAIEGVIVPEAGRAEAIIDGRSQTLRTRSEQELAGYRDALDYLFQQDWRPLNVGLLLHLHRLLFGHTAAAGGRLKTDDNLVVDRASDGTTTVRFRPVPANQTDYYLDELVSRYREAVAARRHHPVLLIGLFALDLSIIHPFEDGNGRVTRTVTNALLADEGYTVVRYVSLEQLIADSADAYYEALLGATHDWHEDTADPWPWLTYFVEILSTAYQRFNSRAAAEQNSETKQERVRHYVEQQAPQVFRLADVRAALPGISDPTIRLVLQQLRAQGLVIPDGAGRAAVWRRAAGPR
ncbi:Fic family protein [Natronosporangium hydrolyticum]|uniref:Fic family protein n=1 Tax=Natronosporangium hydrolyticum TaxID=2811111 RepID=A0A895YF50_9ACTN|nr:Fic family protein [Natronosporangium hydrolyticum]QSB16211.1 Fic family protein [Natronosporangium hydrolyticum]